MVKEDIFYNYSFFRTVLMEVAAEVNTVFIFIYKNKKKFKSMKMNFFNYLVITLIRGYKTFCLTTLTVALAAVSMKVDNVWLFTIDWICIIWNILLLTYYSATSIHFDNKEEIKELAKMWEEKEKEGK